MKAVEEGTTKAVPLGVLLGLDTVGGLVATNPLCPGGSPGVSWSAPEGHL